MLRSALAPFAATLAALAFSTAAHAADLQTSYTVDDKALKTAVSGTSFTFALYSDSACTTAVDAANVLVDNVDVIERVKRFKPKGGAKPPNTARVVEVLTGVTTAPTLYLKLTGTGITPVGGDCQLQYASADTTGAQIPCLSQVGNEVIFSGCNVNVQSGSGSTAGTVNGLGNLVVGYNALAFGDLRTGSHNLVIGDFHSYSSYGGLVAGQDNSITGGHATVSGGVGNTASGAFASVSGGSSNTASGSEASVSGGAGNTASDSGASVSGGILNVASNSLASVSGGEQNTASGARSSVSGGSNNTASDFYASVSGGDFNTASGPAASVSGGEDNIASVLYASVSGGKCNVAGPGIAPSCSAGNSPSVSGGFRNVASGGNSSVTGGTDNWATSTFSSVTGGNTNTASGDRATVTGGNGNTASGPQSVVGGGIGISTAAANEFHAAKAAGFPTGTQY